MQKPEIPTNEGDRLIALQRYQILDTLPEQEYDDLTQLAADICGTPIALISLIDRDRQWFKSRVGLDATETPRDISFCGHAVAADEMLYVPDTAQDLRFSDNPLVAGDPNIRFYTGVPLRTSDNFVLGTLCVIDVKPRELTPHQIKQLEALSRITINQLELRRLNNQTNSLYISIVESSGDAIITKTPHGIITSWNKSAERMFGYTEAEAIGQPITMLISNKRLEEENKILEGITHGEKIEQYEAVRLRKDGIPLDVSVTISPIKDSYGHIVGNSKIVRDITDLKKSQAQVRDITDALNQTAIIVITDAFGSITMMNDKFCEISKYSREELLGQNHRMINSGYHPRQFFVEMWKEIAKGKTWRAEIKNRAKDGSFYWVDTTIVPFLNEQDKPYQYLAIRYDVTPRKLAEIELQKLSLRLELAIKSDRIGIWEWDISQNKMEWDKRMYVLYGISQSDGQVVYDAWSNGIHPNDRDITLTLLQQAILGKAEYNIEFRFVHHDGNIRYIKAYGVEKYDEHGNSQGITGVDYDITDRKQAESLVNESNQQLLAANAELGRISRFKDEFLANMSHEIRTPMNAIIGMNYLILNTELTIHQRNYLQKAQTASHHLLSVINDILDFSKIEAGKLTIEQVDFELEKVLENVATLISEKASSKGLEIIFDINRDLPRNFIGDPMRLGQILTNYAGNAVKFTEKGEITLIVRLQEYREEDVTLYIAVKDTGIGMKEEEIKLLFHSFQQADTSTTRKFGGTGLGLAISKRIVELMGGEVGVESEFGKGSTFWFTVCLGKSTTTRRRRIFSGDIAGKLVLVVDDNENARLILKDLLEQMKLEVDMVDSGQAALAAVAEADTGERPYEIVFLDWKMPSMDGIEVARQIKMLSLKHKPHHLLVTAGGQEGGFNKAKTIGIDAVLLKPINASNLANALAEVLGGDSMYSSTDAFTASISIWSDRLKPVRGSKILLVEDDEVNQEVAIGLLEEAGLVVDVANNGIIAIEKVKNNDYALVLMDMQMPEMDGVNATVEIRRDPRYQSLPIVAMTANVMEVDRDKCFAAGMNDHLAKPIEPDELGKVLLKWIPPNPILAHISDPSASVKEEEAIAIPANISGLNTSEGLRRVIGKRSLYLSMLRRFVAGQSHFADQFNQAIKASDFHLAERLAHTLKGVAGNIGAEVIEEAAAALETGIRNEASRSEVELLLNALRRPLKSLIDALESHLPPELVSVDIANIDWTHLEQICHQLSELLIENDAEAVEFLQDHTDLMRSSFPNNYKAISSAINTFDFDNAHAALILAVETLKKDVKTWI